jgi:hypothetical protein
VIEATKAKASAARKKGRTAAYASATVLDRMRVSSSFYPTRQGSKQKTIKIMQITKINIEYSKDLTISASEYKYIGLADSLFHLKKNEN